MIKRKFWRRIQSGLAVGIALSLSVIMPITSNAAVSGGALEAIESAEASTIQLMKTEGDVAVSKAGGRNISIIKNMKLYNGYQMKTEEASYAWTNLDSEKLTKLDAVSESEIRKSGKKLEILLKSGNLFFDVTEPLEEEETLNIRTSTMVMGIRGTSGWVKVIDRWHSQVYILEGTVVCYVSDPVTGQTKSTTLSGGETAEFVVYEQDQNGERCDIIRQGFSETDIDGFVLAELAQDSGLCEKIKEASGLDAGSAAKGASERLARDESRMSERLEAIQTEYGAQENHISKDPVWEHGRDTSRILENSGMPGTESASSGGNSSNGGNPSGGGTSRPGSGQTGTEEDSPGEGDSSSGENNSQTVNSGDTNNNVNADNSTNTTPPTVLTAGTDDISTENIQDKLNDAAVAEVVVKPNTAEPENQATVTVEEDTELIIPDGKTLTLDGVNMEVQEDAVVRVDGTLNINGSLVNDGTIIVNGPLPDYVPD